MKFQDKYNDILKRTNGDYDKLVKLGQTAGQNIRQYCNKNNKSRETFVSATLGLYLLFAVADEKLTSSEYKFYDLVGEIAFPSYDDFLYTAESYNKDLDNTAKSTTEAVTELCFESKDMAMALSDFAMCAIVCDGYNNGVEMKWFDALFAFVD